MSKQTKNTKPAGARPMQGGQPAMAGISPFQGFKAWRIGAAWCREKATNSLFDF